MRNLESIQQLEKLCADIKSIKNVKKIIEIGSYMGESSAIFAKNFPNAKIICIDPWEKNYDELDPTSFSDFEDVEKQFDLRKNLFDNIEKRKGYSLEFKEIADFVYIDGCHKYECVKEDLIHWKNYTDLIGGHDFIEDDNFLKDHIHIIDVKKAVLEIVGQPDKIYLDGSWIKKIK